LLANASNPGSNSLTYITENYNTGTGLNRKTITLQTAFDDLGYGNIYKQYKKQLKKLEKKNTELTQYGNLLLFAIPKDKINDLVYLTTDDDSRKNIHIDGIGKTDNITEIMETLRNNPEKISDTDKTEFALIKTYDKNGGLNPESGVKVFNFNAVDPAEWQAYRTKENKLFEQIRQSIINQQS